MGECDIPMGADGAEAIRGIMGPGYVNGAVRSAIQACWHVLPREKRTVAAVEAEVRRIVDRAFKDMREDARAFGIAEAPPRDS